MCIRDSLLKAPGVRKEIDPLTNGQLAAAVLKGDSVRSAHLFGEGGLPLEFVNF